MASTYSADLKLELMTTGEKSGLWGDITNTNLVILQQSIGGYESIALNATTGATLVFSNGVTSNGKNAVLNLTGTITTSVNVVIPDSIEKMYTIKNATSGSHAVVVKTTSGSGVTWSSADKGTKMVYSNGTDVIDTGFTYVSSDYAPQLSADLDTNGNNILIDDATGILDDSSNEQLIFQKTASAVNHFEMTNAAVGSNPILSAVGDDTNIGLEITTKGTGLIKLNDAAYNAEATLTDGATIDWAVNAAPVAKVTLAGNRTINAPTGGSAGQFVSLLVIQDATGVRTLTWNAVYEFASDTAPVLTTTADLGDLFVFRYNGTKWLEVGRNQALTLS
jgi:hypothetical protein